MTQCMHCQKEFYQWEAENGTAFHYFCSEKCIKDHKEELKNQDWPRDPALKYKVPVGEIACPHCGTVQHGILHPICGFCDKAYWKKEELDEENNPYFYEQG